MKLRRNTPAYEAELHRARNRVAEMSTFALLEWADVAGSGMAKGFQDYRRESARESLLEIRSALIALTALNDELLERNEAGQ